MFDVKKKYKNVYVLLKIIQIAVVTNSGIIKLLYTPIKL